MTATPRIGISSCLLGNKVRYDGGHKRDRFICDTLGRHVQFVAICPEVECGLPVPREPIRLTGRSVRPRVVGVESGIDHSERLYNWAAKRLPGLKEDQLCGFVFKKNSPSCGLARVKVFGRRGGILAKGVGVFARAFMDGFPLIPTVEAEDLQDMRLAVNFSERFLALQRWQTMLGEDCDLAAFHAYERVLLQAHSPRHRRVLDALAAAGGPAADKAFLQHYAELFMQALTRRATRAKNLLVLQHIQHRLKKELSGYERKEFIEILDAYREGHLPVSAPIALARYLAGKYGPAVLAGQSYLNLQPLQTLLLHHFAKRS